MPPHEGSAVTGFRCALSLEPLASTNNMVSSQVWHSMPTHGDRVEANPLLDDTLAILSDLARRPLVERVLSRREILGA